MESCKYVHFGRLVQSKELEAEFLVLVKHGHPVLNEILTKSSQKIKIKFYVSTEDSFGDIILVMIVSNDDHISNALGKKHNFPRGFPIIWNKSLSTVETFGFYPKFENDKRKKEVHSFKDVSSIRLNYKYSGFLGQFVAFKHNGNYCWTTCAKNSACANKPDEFDFSADAARIIAPQATYELVSYLANNNMFFCGEVMSKNDANHGANVITEAFVVTMFGTSRLSIQTHEGIVIKGSQEPFRTIFNQDEVFELCLRFKLSVDDVYTINSNCEDFGRILHECRDTMTLSQFEAFIDRMRVLCNIVVRRGTIRHIDILGERLEGLIKKLNKGKTQEIVKYKFPFYTIVTMLLRNIIMANLDSRKPEKMAIIRQNIGKWFVPTFYAHLQQWVEDWVVEKSDYWFFVGTLIVAKINELMETYNPASNVGFQIFVLDSIFRLPEFQYNSLLDYKAIQQAFRIWNDEVGEEFVGKLKYDKFIVATGSTKTAFVKKLVESQPEKFAEVPVAKNTEAIVKNIDMLFRQGKTPIFCDSVSIFVGGKENTMLLAQNILDYMPGRQIKCFVLSPLGNVEDMEAFKELHTGLHEKRVAAIFKDANKSLELVPLLVKNLEQNEMFGTVLTYSDPELESFLTKL